MITKEYTILLSSELDKLADANEFVVKHLSEENISYKIITNIETVVDEIFTNISNYSGASEVEIIFSIEGESMSLTFIDDGVQFDPTKLEAPNIDAAIDERRIGGLGIYMVRQIMDIMEYRWDESKKQNILILKKSIK